MSVDYVNSSLPLAGEGGLLHELKDTGYVNNFKDIQLNVREVGGSPAVNFTALVALQPSTTILTPIIMFSIGMVGNVIACGVYHCSASWHRDTAFYGILRGFFITSIIGYLTVYPIMISVHLKGLRWIGGSRLCDFHGFAILTFGMSLAYITGVLGFERFLAACRPLTYNRKVEPRKIPFVLVLLWLVSVFTGILPLVGFGRINLQYPSTWCFIDWRDEETVGRLFSSVLATIIAAVILLVIVSIIAATAGAAYRTVKKYSQTIAGKDNDRGRYSLTLTIDDNSHRIPRRYFAADRALLWATLHYDVLACGFLVCYIPVVMRIISNVSGQPVNNFKNMAAMHWAEFYPAFCPWLYILCHEQIWARLTCKEPAYRDVPYSRRSMRRRSSRGSRTSARRHDRIREASVASSHRESVVSETSNHVNVVMHDHVDGYVVGSRHDGDGCEEPRLGRGRSAKRKLEFIKEDDTNSGPLPKSPAAATTALVTNETSTTQREQDQNQRSPSSSSTISPPSSPQDKLPSSPPSSPTPTTTDPLIAKTSGKSKLVVTNSYPAANGPVIQNHVNASRSKSSSGCVQVAVGAGSRTRKGEYTRVPTEPGDSTPMDDVVARRTAFMHSGRKESSI